MKNLSVKPPSGTRDFLPAEAAKRHAAFEVIRASFGLAGFLPMETPAFERIETLTGKYGEEGEKLIFKIMNRGEKEASGEADLALRYDLTIPLVRYYAANQSLLPTIFKRYQIGPVWRADRPGKGRYREFYQCDIDILGNTSLLADAEILATLVSTIRHLGLPKCTVKLNSRKALKGLCDSYGLDADEAKDFMVVIDKMDKVGAEGVVAELEERAFDSEVVSHLKIDLENVDSVRLRISQNEIGKAGLEEIDFLANIFKNDSEVRIEYTPFLARGLDYYTGPIFEIFAEGFPFAISSGGRYDNLVGSLTGKQLPACGGSLGLDRILLLLEEHVAPAKVSSADILVTVWDQANLSNPLSFARRLRKAGFRAELYVGKAKFGDQLSYASKQGISLAVIQGPEELEKKSVAIKDLRSGEQIIIPEAELEDEVKEALNL